MNSGREDFAAYAVVSPPPARAARSGEGSGAGGASAASLRAGSRVDRPTTPDASAPLRGGRGADPGRTEIELNSTSVVRNTASVLPAPVGSLRITQRSSRDFAIS